METKLHFGIFIFLVNFIRYIFIAGLFFGLFYVVLRNSTKFRKLQSRFPKWKDYRREFLASTLSCVVFGVVGWLAYKTPFYEFSLAYSNLHDYPIWYFWLSIALMIVLHDTYFYWTHRLIHHKSIFKYIHGLHHQSFNPTPWAAFAFNLPEAIINGLFQFLLMLLIPSHFYAVAIFYLISLIINVYGHLGYEILPANIENHWLGRWINTSTAHNFHHHYSKGNFGFYFTFWDRLMGTYLTKA